jgi:hypothetical protein
MTILIMIPSALENWALAHPAPSLAPIPLFGL